MTGGARCSSDFGTFHTWPDGTVMVGCGCGWTLDRCPSRRRAKRSLHEHRVRAAGGLWLKGPLRPLRAR